LANFNENAERVLEQTGQVVEQTMSQTRGAMEQYFHFLQNALSSVPGGSPELVDKMKSFTEQNITEAQQFVQKLSQAKDLQDVMRIQTDYMQNQFQAFGEQTKSLAETFMKSTTGIMKNPLRNY
jgi:phasin family protein